MLMRFAAPLVFFGLLRPRAGRRAPFFPRSAHGSFPLPPEKVFRPGFISYKNNSPLGGWVNLSSSSSSFLCDLRPKQPQYKCSTKCTIGREEKRKNSFGCQVHYGLMTDD